jgi:hypothetical protein
MVIPDRNCIKKPSDSEQLTFHRRVTYNGYYECVFKKSFYFLHNVEIYSEIIMVETQPCLGFTSYQQG